MAAVLPPEVTYEILSRLPIKSLARFRCVCKSWFKFINDPYLRSIHVKEEATPIMLQQFPCVYPMMINKECQISYLRGVTDHPVFKFCYRGGIKDQKLVLGSCNGLFLVCYEKAPYLGTFMFAVINPVLDNKERHNLPPIYINNMRHSPMDRHFPREAAGIGFDDSTNTFKTVFVILKDRVQSRDINVVRKQLCTMVHYSSGITSWREIAQNPAYPITGEGVFAHRRLHWLVNRADWHHDDDARKVVWFDLKTEDFGVKDGPIPRGGGVGTGCQLVDLNGEVGFGYVGLTCIELWILKREDEWELHCWFDTKMLLVDVAVSGFWNKDGDIAFTSGGGKRLFVYVVKTGDLVETDHRRDGLCELAHVRMHQRGFFSVSGMYQQHKDKKLC